MLDVRRGERRGGKIRVMGSEAYSRNPFVQLMISALSYHGSVVLRPYSFWRSLSTWPDIWHLNWPERSYKASNALVCLLKCSKLLVQLDMARLIGTRIVWTVHNLTPHETQYPKIEAWFWESFHHRVDLFVHLSMGGGQLFRERFPAERSKQHAHLRHPAYPIPDSARVDRERAREIIGVEQDATMFLMSGMLRRYKNIPAAVQAFRGLRDPDSRLVIAGYTTSDELEREIVAAIGDDARIRTRFGYLENRDLYTFIRASDLALLPYDRFLNSGVLMLSLSLARPVLAPLTPVTREISAEVGSGWVSTYSTTLSADVLARGAEWIDRREPNNTEPDLSQYDWEAFAEGLTSAYRQVIDSS